MASTTVFRLSEVRGGATDAFPPPLLPPVAAPRPSVDRRNAPLTSFPPSNPPVPQVGKYTLGYKTVLKSLRSGKSKPTSPTTALLASRRSSTTRCSPRLAFTTTPAVSIPPNSPSNHRARYLASPRQRRKRPRRRAASRRARLRGPVTTGFLGFGPNLDRASAVPLAHLRRPTPFPLADNVDLGTACGRYESVSCMSITDPGDSDIIKSSHLNGSNQRKASRGRQRDNRDRQRRLHGIRMGVEPRSNSISQRGM